ncbi:alpha/beta hydrolase fold domain-containing protein [Polaribacter sp. Hel1_85]|uniref:alpha/beta hydrolase fold domain-containing protein n=1 Tax=Polaribacter sp. Hel1_85 TaxID=1250005 RepID=UPI00052CFE7F|nr:alpha/beta hydrolase fold domain-containing protein [Polaribacter sp. Hel1_85]KGL62294.1 beta-helix fold protein [Polaribacter sp. Hel1_85]
MTKYLIATLLFLLTITKVNSQHKIDGNQTNPQELIYKVIDGDTLKLTLFYPKKIKRKTPTIVFFFGGGWNGGSITQFEDQSKYFASRGMISILVDYRVKNRHKTTPFDAVRDAKSAIRYIRKHAKELHVNPKKIAVSGGSAGGHLAAATATLEGLNEPKEDLSISVKANALILYNPVIDNSKNGYGYKRVGERYKEISPLHNIKKGVPPTIFFLGDKDKLIPVATAKNYKAKMEAVGSRCDLFVYKNQPHGFFNQWKKGGVEHYLKTTYEADIFLESLGYLKGKPTFNKPKTIELFVSKKGAVKNEGTKESPFLKLESAVKKATAIKSKRENAKVIINVLPGDYHLEKPIIISPLLNGLTIKGTNSSDVTIKGSKILNTNWKKFNNDIYVTKVASNLDFDQLIVNDTPQILARYPNYDEKAHYWQGFASDAISKERIATWKNPKVAYFNALHGGKWGGFHFEITGVDKEGNAILKGGQQNNRGSKPHKEYRMVENVFEELDGPGEWYLDKETHQLYYWPTKNVNIENSKVEVAVLKDLIQVVGTLEKPVKNVTISGISFKYTKRTFLEKFEPLLRSDWSIYRGSVVFFEGTENCEVKDSEFAYLGGNVLMASKYNKGLEIKGNHIHNNGASAISFIGDPSAVRSPSFNYGQFVALSEMDTISGPKNELYPRACLVKDNLIHRIGCIEKQTAGVQIAMAMSIKISHNSIYDVPRAGINIGDGTWGGHVLEFNDVFNTVLETSDHGSFNSWGRDRFWLPKRNKMNELTTQKPDMYTWDAVKTTVIRNNRFRCDHGWDIDLDDGSSNYHIYNNLLLNNGLKLREGFNRVAENNIMVNNSLHPHVWFANSRDVFKHNIVGDTYQDVGLLGWGKELDYNFFPTEEAMMKSQMYNRDLNSFYGDPMFKDPKHLDFSVKENSPALKVGFKNFPMNKFGVQKANLKKLAKTPEIPVLRDVSKIGAKERNVKVAWLRNTLKSVSSEQEQSAYGLNTAEGVIVLKIWKPSPAVQNNGIKKGDVILEANSVKLKNVKDFFTVLRNNNKLELIDIVVMRNQSELPLKIRFK